MQLEQALIDTLSAVSALADLHLDMRTAGLGLSALLQLPQPRNLHLWD